MLGGIAKPENDRYLGIEAVNLKGRKISGRIEYQPVNTGGQYHFSGNQIRSPAIFVSGRFADQLPAACGFDFQGDRHACGGPTF
jgi:hypothetical protein